MTRSCLLLAGVSLAVATSLHGAESASAVPKKGMVLWLDASDASTLSVEGKDVQEWRDRSGNGKHFAAPDKASRPQLNKTRPDGLATISFDGASQYVSGPAVLPEGQRAYTIIALWRPLQYGGMSVFEQATPNVGGARAALLATGLRYGFCGQGHDCGDLVPFTPSAWRLTSMSVDMEREKTVRVSDNGKVFEGVPLNPKDLKVGIGGGSTVGRKVGLPTEYFKGEVAEIIVYDRVLSPEEESVLLASLSGKWMGDSPSDFHSPDGRVLKFDFEGDTYGDWKPEGAAFGTAPARRCLQGQMDLSGFKGRGFADSSTGGDPKSGGLTSPAFLIEQPYINFLISGAKAPGKAEISLIIDGKTVRATTGPNEKYPESERLEWASWDVKEFVGKTATIQMVGSATGMEHINIDEITPGNRKLEEPAAQREIAIEHPYLHLPVKNGAPERRVRFVVDGKLVRDFTIELADGEPDFQVFSDVSAFKGQKLRIEVDHLPKAAMLESIVAADEVPGASEMYQEKYRPQFHFSPRRGWVGDPNGLVFYKGEYHLFFQHNPYAVKFGNIHWGHAVSTDLVHWKELPLALYPFRFGDWPYSGGAVVDKANTAGFKAGPEDALVVVYPSTGRGICIVSSTDSGRTLTPYAGNPLPPRDMGGDPRVIWHEPTHQWVMLTSKRLVNATPGTPDWLIKSQCGFDFFTSPDLKNWTHQSRIEDYWECPELFELPVDGDKGHTKWVVYSNATPSLCTGGKHVGGRYVIGTFDGKRFTEETGKLQLNFGNAYGAAQSYNNIPAEDGRRINFGCAFGTRMPGMPFEQMMDFPTELTLRTTEEGPRLFTQPVREIKSLYASTRKMDDVTTTPEGTVLPGVQGDLFDVSAEFAIGAETEEVGFKVRGVPITYNVKAGQLTCGDRTAPLKPVDGKIKIRFLLDRASIEIFANDGRVYMPMAVVPKDSERSIAVFAKGPGAKVTALTVNELKSAWAR